MFRLYKCETCGRLEAVSDTRLSVPECCGQPMKAVEARSSKEEGKEKHVPVVTRDDNILTVKVGRTPHPMEEQHYIQLIVLETTHGIKQIRMIPGVKPEAVFFMNVGEVPVRAYAYCNLHGLWQTDVHLNAKHHPI